MKIISNIFSLTLVLVFILTILGGVISVNIQDHSQMMMEGGCESNEECIFHHARTVFEDNAVSTTSPLQLVIFIISSFLLSLISQPGGKLDIKSHHYYLLKLLKFKNRWTSYLRRSIDKLKVHPVSSSI